MENDIADCSFLRCKERFCNPDSCHGRVIRIDKKIVSYVPPTAVVKLLQYSGLGSNTGMNFHPTNDSYQCLKMVRIFVWIFGFGLKQGRLFVHWLL